MLAVTLFSAFLLELLPGDPVEVLVPFGSDEQRESVREDLRLDHPFIARYGNWLGGFVHRATSATTTRSPPAGPCPNV